VILTRRADIDRFLAGPDPAILASLVYGRDLGVVRERAELLAAVATARPNDPFDVAVISEGDLEGDAARLDGELMAISMVGGRRLVRLRLSGERQSADRLAAEALGDHLAGRFNPEAFFLIEAGVLARDSVLRRVAEKAPACAVIACYEDEPGDLARFTREALAADALSLTAEALEMFVGRLPHERGVARREIERLALFLGPGSGKIASAGDLDGFFGVEPDASLAAAANDAFGGRRVAAYAGLRRAAQEGESGPAAVRALSVHLARLRRVAALHQGGVSLQVAAKAAGVFWKDEREFLRQARLWNLTELERLQPGILAADRACKQTGAPDRVLAERLALAVAARARRLGL